MSADAITGDAYTVTFGSDLHILGFLKSGDVCLHQRRSTVGHHIAGYAARKVPEIARELPAHKGTAKAALFTIAHREVGIGCETEGRHGVPLQIVIHIGHAGFLTAAQQYPQGIGKGLAGLVAVLLEELCHIQSQQSRALIITDAPSDQPAVLFDHTEGIAVPAIARRHHVQMRNGGKLGFTCTLHIGITHISIAFPGFKPQVPGNLQSGIQCLAHARTIGGIRLCRCLYAVNVNDCLEVPDQCLPVFCNKGVHMLLDP